jgi:hypothetical protein
MGHNMNKFRPSLITAGLVASGLAFSLAAYAQDAENTQKTEEEIEVTFSLN